MSKQKVFAVFGTHLLNAHRFVEAFSAEGLELEFLHKIGAKQVNKVFEQNPNALALIEVMGWAHEPVSGRLNQIAAGLFDSGVLTLRYASFDVYFNDVEEAHRRDWQLRFLGREHSPWEIAEQISSLLREAQR